MSMPRRNLLENLTKALQKENETLNNKLDSLVGEDSHITLMKSPVSFTEPLATTLIINWLHIEIANLQRIASRLPATPN